MPYGLSGDYFPGMCGRYTRKYTWREVRAFLDLKFPEHLDLEPSFNVAPTHTAPIVREGGRGREMAMATWGLVPHWADDPKVGARMINARAETVASKPAYRDAFKKRRCVVPISGFYEWQARDKGPKQPYYTTRADGEIMCLAGLWERWDKGGEPLETYTIITAEANALLQPIHPRMPAVLEREQVNDWLRNGADAAVLAGFLRPAAAGILEAHLVSTRVGNVANDDAALIEPKRGASGALFGQGSEE
ncbi:MAG: SOS response-associated peptidase [Phycisphaerales bacterium]